jgi:Protein of unknown function (DUF541)
MKKFIAMFFLLGILTNPTINAQTLSVCGEAKGVLSPSFAIFNVTIDDGDCSARFPDIHSKQKRYAEITKAYAIPASDNVFVDEKTMRVDDYEGAKDVHIVNYLVTCRNADTMMLFINAIESEIPGTDVSLSHVEFGENNATREMILTKAYADAKHRAEVLAKLGNGKAGKMLSITEERFNEEGSILETLFNADKKYKKDDYAYAFTQLFPNFNILIRVDFEFIPN